MAAFAERAWPDERHTFNLHHHMVGNSLHVCRTVFESCAVSVVTSHCCLTDRFTACHSFAVPHTNLLVSTGFNPTFTVTIALCAASGIKQPIHADFGAFQIILSQIPNLDELWVLSILPLWCHLFTLALHSAWLLPRHQVQPHIR